jgi:hypothetical protein
MHTEDGVARRFGNKRLQRGVGSRIKKWTGDRDLGGIRFQHRGRLCWLEFDQGHGLGLAAAAGRPSPTSCGPGRPAGARVPAGGALRSRGVPAGRRVLLRQGAAPPVQGTDVPRARQGLKTLVTNGSSSGARSRGHGGAPSWPRPRPWPMAVVRRFTARAPHLRVWPGVRTTSPDVPQWGLKATWPPLPHPHRRSVIHTLPPRECAREHGVRPRGARSVGMRRGPARLRPT